MFNIMGFILILGFSLYVFIDTFSRPCNNHLAEVNNYTCECDVCKQEFL